MNEHELKITIEATLLAAGRPVTTQQLIDLFEERERPTPEQLQAALEQLANDYADRGIELAEIASGWRIQVRQRCMEAVSRLWHERPSKYSRALLETLALIAYRQPITRSEIEEIRGVAISSTIMRTLQERNWIRVVGHREVPGRPELLGTTREFLDYFGLKSLDQLPTLAELRDVETIGVQLELPGGEAQAGESESGEPVASADTSPEVANESNESNESNELSESNESNELNESGEAVEASAAAEPSEADDDEDGEPTGEDSANDEPELSADADEIDDEDETPTLVASADDEADVRYGEPPDDR